MKLTAKLALLALTVLIAAGVIATVADASTDPVGNFDFVVEIEGLEASRVTEVHGLTTETDIIEYRSGADRVIRKLPGRHRVGNIVIRRAVTEDQSWWEWRKAIVDGAADQRSVRIRVLDPSRSDPRLTVIARRAWPAAYRIAALDANESHVLYEEMELAVESIERDE